MASPTPHRPPENEEQHSGYHENEGEPLLGRPGDASQPEGKSSLNNLVLGTGIIAQLGIGLLFVLIWASVFTKPVILFSGHPLGQSLAVLLLAQSIMFLQPTRTAEQKQAGQVVHAYLNLLAFVSLVVGVTFIEYNKIASRSPHFHSVHSYVGGVTLVLLLVQYFIGFTMWATPRLYGGEDNAKAIWKYHRWSGYVVLILLLTTVNLATQTDYNRNVLHMKLWATGLLSLLVVVGIYPRIQKQKLGLGRRGISI